LFFFSEHAKDKERRQEIPQETRSMMWATGANL